MMEERILAMVDKKEQGLVDPRRLRKVLGISAIHLCQALEVLNQLGYGFAFTASGRFRMVNRPDILTPLEIKAHLGASSLIKEVFSFRQTSSTNTLAFHLARAGAREGTVVVAESQYAGRGRFGRCWESPPFVNIYCSVILKPEKWNPGPTPITLLGTLAAASAIEKVSGLRIQVRWPNDLVMGGKKIGGVLTETAQSVGGSRFLVVGTGINVNAYRQAFSVGIQKHITSLAEEAGRKFSRVSLLGALLMHLEEWYALYNQEGLLPLVEKWEELSHLKGQQVRVTCQDGSHLGMALGLDEDGQLLVRGETGQLEVFPAHQVLKLEAS